MGIEVFAITVYVFRNGLRIIIYTRNDARIVKIVNVCTAFGNGSILEWALGLLFNNQEPKRWFRAF